MSLWQIGVALAALVVAGVGPASARAVVTVAGGQSGGVSCVGDPYLCAFNPQSIRACEDAMGAAADCVDFMAGLPRTLPSAIAIQNSFTMVFPGAPTWTRAQVGETLQELDPDAWTFLPAELDVMFLKPVTGPLLVEVGAVLQTQTGAMDAAAYFLFPGSWVVGAGSPLLLNLGALGSDVVPNSWSLQIYQGVNNAVPEAATLPLVALGLAAAALAGRRRRG